jgi:hypothetical protein
MDLFDLHIIYTVKKIVCILKMDLFGLHIIYSVRKIGPYFKNGTNPFLKYRPIFLTEYIM